MEIRLDKLLANQTAYSRKDVRQILKKGTVSIDGITETDGSRKVNPELQMILCEGKRVQEKGFCYVIMNKPAGYLSATEDRKQKTVMDLLPAYLREKGLFPAGRLDIDSTGFLLLTNDGGFAHRMLSPKKHVSKYYLVTLEQEPDTAALQKLREGISLSDNTICLPAEVRKISVQHCLICLHEGKYHQVKRMFAAVGNHVQHLHRTAVGGFILPPDLRPGQCLEILHKDAETLLKSQPFPEMCEQIMSDFPSYLINDSQ